MTEEETNVLDPEAQLLACEAELDKLENKITELQMEVAVLKQEAANFFVENETLRKQNDAHHDDLHGRYPVCPWCQKQLTAIAKKPMGKKAKRGKALEA